MDYQDPEASLKHGDAFLDHLATTYLPELQRTLAGGYLLSTRDFNYPHASGISVESQTGEVWSFSFEEWVRYGPSSFVANWYHRLPDGREYQMAANVENWRDLLYKEVPLIEAERLAADGHP